MMQDQQPFAIGSRQPEQRNEEEVGQQDEDGEDELLNVLMGLGLGVLIGTLLLKAAKSGVKGDVASEFADALEAGVGS